MEKNGDPRWKAVLMWVGEGASALSGSACKTVIVVVLGMLGWVCVSP